MNLIQFLKLFPKAFKEWIQDRADGLAASIAYYQFMSIAPFVALIVLASSAIFGEEQFKSEIEPLFSHFFHPQFIIAIKYMLKYSFGLDDSKFLAISVLAVLSLVHGTFGFFAQIKDSIESFWNVRAEEAKIKARITKTIEALFMASICFLLLIIGFVIAHWFSGQEGILHILIMVAIEFIVLFAIFLFLLTYCPPGKIHWKKAFPGVLITTILYMLGRFILKFILSNQQTSAEDVAASLILYLLWAYYSSLVFLFGAEFSKAYIEKKGK